MISQKFRAAVKLHSMRDFKIAQAADINPSILSRIVTGALQVEKGDKRVKAVAEVLGIPVSECFVDE
jgi:hypothetical protein